MHRLIICWVLLLPMIQLSAQGVSPSPVGDTVPDASRIRVQMTDDPLRVTLTGEAGAVSQSAALAVRNVYTGVTAYGQANFDGSFSIDIEGTPGMVYQVNTALRYPLADRDAYDILPGTGTIIAAPADNPAVFDIGGELSYGGTAWYGQGTIDALNYTAGDSLLLRLEATLQTPDADLALDYYFSGELALRPFFDAGGQPINTGNGYGWSSTLTATGLPVIGAALPDTSIGRTPAEIVTVDAENNTITLSFAFDAALPDDLPLGLYIPVFTGRVQIADGMPVNWYANRIFSTQGTRQDSGAEITRLPLMIQVGAAAAPQLVVSLFGRVADEQRTRIAVTNLYDYPPAQTILSPGSYDVNPLLPQLLLYGRDALPLLLPQRVDAMLAITKPDDTTDTLSLTALKIEDNRAWLAAPVVDLLQYGEYTLVLSGEIVDWSGNRYDLAGTYEVTIAEPLTLHPAVLPGTPFEPGDVFNGAVQILPDLPADVRLTLQADETDLLTECQQNCVHRWQETGVYQADYAARYTDSDGRLWAGQLRTAGVIADDIAQGQRGLFRQAAGTPQIWYDTRAYPADVPDALPIVNFPFFSGDIAFIPDSATGGINPTLTTGGTTYLSIIRPSLRLRQIVVSGELNPSHDQPLWISNEDALDNQIGAGSEGNQPGDVLLLFGGASQDDTTSGYAAAAVVTDDDYARVVPPFDAPLLADASRRNEIPADMIVLPTEGIGGQLYSAGEQAVFSAYVVPPVPARIDFTLQLPDGQTITRLAEANRYGYAAIDEPVELTATGIYRLSIRARYDGVTSQGQLDRTIEGYPPGAEAASYPLFVVPPDAPLLETARPPLSTVAGGQVVILNVRAPQQWQDVDAYYVVRAAGRIIEQGDLPVAANQSNYQFNWAQVARLYPNIEATAQTAADVDEIQFYIAMTGTAEDGSRQIRTRAFTLRGNQLFTQAASQIGAE